jgi:hypothetical protein
MAVKKNTYVSAELDWAEQQLSSWKPTAKGGMLPMVIASIESQGKFVQETMKNYLALLEQVDKLREKEEAKKIETRGGAELGSMAEEFLKGRG